MRHSFGWSRYFIQYTKHQQSSFFFLSHSCNTSLSFPLHLSSIARLSCCISLFLFAYKWLSISFETSVSSQCFADWAESQRVGTLPFLFTFPPTVPHLYSLFLSSVFRSPFLLFQLTSLSPYFIPIAATTSKVCNYSCSRVLHVLEPVCVTVWILTHILDMPLI